MKKILVPTDFSTCANNAVNFAVQSAKIAPMEITIISAFELMGDLYTDYMGVNKEFNQSQFREVQGKLDQLKNKIKEEDGINVETFVVTGAVKEAILEVTKEKEIDLIIMGTTGAGGVKEKLWGSKTTKIIGRSQVPVMVIPLEYEWQKPQKILLATNHYEKESSIHDLLFELIDLYTTELHVVVYTDEKDDAATFLEHSRETPEYEKMLKKESNLEKIYVSNLFGKDFEQAIDDYVRQNMIDILVMVTYKRNLPDRVFRHSVTKHLACHTKIPLLAIPAMQE